MPPELGTFVADPKSPRTWTGINRMDAAVLQNLLDSEIIKPIEMYTNVRVGSVPDFRRFGTSPDLADLGRKLWSKRVDLVLRQEDGWFVVEIKPFASYVALGQALTYQFLAEREYPQIRNSAPGIAAVAVDPDIESLLQDIRNVRTFLVPGGSYDDLESAGVFSSSQMSNRRLRADLRNLI